MPGQRQPGGGGSSHVTHGLMRKWHLGVTTGSEAGAKIFPQPFQPDPSNGTKYLPWQLYQARHTATLLVIGNTIGKAKGTVLVSHYGLDYELGVWSQHWRGKSPNVKEAVNLTDWLERLTEELANNVAEQLETLSSLTAKSVLAGEKLVLFGRYVLNLYMRIVPYILREPKTWHTKIYLPTQCTNRQILTSAKNI